MSPTHHPDLTTLLAYTSGAVTEGSSLLVAAHLEGCSACRKAVSNAEILAGGLFDMLPPIALTKNSMHHVWKAIESQPEPESHSPPSSFLGEIPAVLESYLPGGLQHIKWRALGPGIQQVRISELDSGKGSVRLFRLSPGTKIPQHTHQGSELTLILQGSYVDETGRYRRGDFAEADHSLVHQPVVDSAEPCICITTTDNKLIFTRTLNRILQPFIGI